MGGANVGADVTIAIERVEDGRVLALTLNRPKANVLTISMMNDLRQALAGAHDDAPLRMVLLRGAGGSFSYGAAIAEHRRDSAPVMLAALHALVRDIASYPVPVVAMVEGKCLGGAFELVLGCHVVLATPSATFACPEVKLGAVPPVLAVIGHLRLGAPIAERMVVTGCELTAARAEQLGLVASLVPAGTDPRTFALEWYRANLAPLSALALREATHAARAGSGMLSALAAPLNAAERRYRERVLPSRDASEGIEAFLAKRAPRWVDA